MTRSILIVLTLFMLASIGYSQEGIKTNDPQVIINDAINAHGGEAYDKTHFSFIFRKKKYTIRLDNGLFEYSRSFSDSTGNYLDVLTNDGFQRYINDEPIELSAKDLGRYSRSVNSVAYFTLLPKGLNDPAVNKKYVGEVTIRGDQYHAIGITFDEEGGGDDHDDEFRYWVNKRTNTIDYLAYSYHVNGGGVRFREAITPVEVTGIRFQNYINYKPPSKETPLDDLPGLFENDRLKILSEIINENIQPITELN